MFTQLKRSNQLTLKMKTSTKLAVTGLLIITVLFACACVKSINDTKELTRLTMGKTQ